MTKKEIENLLRKASASAIKELEKNGLTGKLEDIKRRESKLKDQLSSCS